MQGLDEILARKSRLCADISRQRLQLSGEVHALQPLISGADRAMAALRSARAHSGWLAAGAGLLVVLLIRRPKKQAQEGNMSALALRWIRRGLLAWRTGTWVWGLVQGALRKV